METENLLSEFDFSIKAIMTRTRMICDMLEYMDSQVDDWHSGIYLGYENSSNVPWGKVQSIHSVTEKNNRDYEIIFTYQADGKAYSYPTKDPNDEGWGWDDTPFIDTFNLAVPKYLFDKAIVIDAVIDMFVENYTTKYKEQIKHSIEQEERDIIECQEKIGEYKTMLDTVDFSKMKKHLD